MSYVSDLSRQCDSCNGTGMKDGKGVALVPGWSITSGEHACALCKGVGRTPKTASH